jgi:hypothetical protein
VTAQPDTDGRIGLACARRWGRVQQDGLPMTVAATNSATTIDRVPW